MNNVFNYKKILAITVGLFFTTFSLYGQKDEGEISFIIGVSGDIGGSNIKMSDMFQGQYITDELKEPSLFSFAAGVDFGIRLGNFYLLSGGAFSRRGGRVEGRVLGINYIASQGITPPADNQEVFISDRIAINYLRIPILAGYRFGNENFEMRLALGIGINSTIGDRAEFRREAEWRNLQIEGQFISGGRTNEDLYGVFLFGDDSRARILESATSFIFSPSFLFRVNDNGYLKVGAIYEAFGDISNGSFNFGNQLVRGEMRMNNISFQIGYEFRFSRGGY